MKKLILFIAIVVAGYATFTGCKKLKDNTTPVTTDTLSDFAKNLALTCTNTFSIQGDSSTFALPTAFTPNGDGINDLYHMVGLYQYFSSYQLTVYKINGTKVFQANGTAASWNGTDTTGAKCTDYKYWVRLKFTTPDKSVDTGTFVFLLSTNTALGCVNRVAADTASYKYPNQFDPSTGHFSFPANETYCN